MQKLVIWLAFGALLSGCGDTQAPQQQLSLTRSAYTAAISQDSQLALTSSDDEGVLLWRLGDAEPLFRWYQGSDPQNRVLMADFSDDGLFALTAESHRFAIWDTTSGENLGFYEVSDSPIRDAAISNSGRYVLVGQENGAATHIDTETGRRLQFIAHQNPPMATIDVRITSVAISPNGYYCLTGGSAGLVYLWDARSGQIIHRFPPAGSRISKVALDRHGRYALSVNSRNQAIIWDLATGLPHSALKPIQRQLIFSATRFSDDGRYLLTGSPARQLILWQVDNGLPVMNRLVTPRDEMRPKGAVVLATGFGDNHDLWSISSSGFAEQWRLPAAVTATP